MPILLLRICRDLNSLTVPTWAAPSLAPWRPRSYLSSQSCLIVSYCLIHEAKFNMQIQKFSFSREKEIERELGSDSHLGKRCGNCSTWISQKRRLLSSCKNAWFIFLRFSSDPFTFGHESQLGEARKEKEKRNGITAKFTSGNETVTTPHFREREMEKKMKKMNANNWMINLYQSLWVTEI